MSSSAEKHLENKLRIQRKFFDKTTENQIVVQVGNA